MWGKEDWFLGRRGHSKRPEPVYATHRALFNKEMQLNEDLYERICELLEGGRKLIVLVDLVEDMGTIVEAVTRHKVVCEVMLVSYVKATDVADLFDTIPARLLRSTYNFRIERYHEGVACSVPAPKGESGGGEESG